MEKKNVFDIDAETQTRDGNAFLTREISASAAQQRDSAMAQVQQLEKKSALPLPLRILQLIAVFVASCTVLGVIKSLGRDVTLAEGFHNAPVIFFAGGIAIVLLIVLWIVGKCKANHAVQTIDVTAIEENVGDAIEQIHSELQIPEDAVDVDVLFQVYKMKNGKRHVKNRGWYRFVNGEMAVYRKDDRLCFSDYHGEWAIPIGEIQGVQNVPKKVQVSGWNKEYPVTAPQLKPYKPIDNNGSIFVRAYYAIEIQSIWGAFEILIPNYDMETVMQIAGLEMHI